MEQLRLTPDSIGAAIALLLATTGTVYLLSLKGKSKQTWVLITYSALLSVMILCGFLQHTAIAAWQPWLFVAKVISYMLMQVTLLQFAHIYLHPHTQQKLPISVKTTLLLCTVVAIHLVGGQVGMEPPYLRLVFRVLLPILLVVLAFAPSIVFFQRSVESSRLSLTKPDSHSSATSGSFLLINPVGMNARGLRAFGLLTMLPIVITGVGILNYKGLISLTARELITAVVGSIYIFGLVFVYFSYTRERTSIHIKLVGLALVTVMLVLNVVALTFYTRERLVSGVGTASISWHQINFQPNSRSGYEISGIKTEPLAANSEPIKLFEISNQERVELGFEFPFYGQAWREVYISDDGVLTFGQALSSRMKSPFRRLLSHNQGSDAVAKIMPLNTELLRDTYSALTVSRKDSSITFSWSRMLHRDTFERSSFAVELSSTGDIVFSYQDIGHTLESGLIGLTPAVIQPNTVKLNFPQALIAESPPDAAVVEDLTLRLRDHVHQQLMPLLVIIVGITCLIIVGFPWFYRIVLTRPLQQLLDGLQKVNDGVLDSEINTHSGDEFGMLGSHFNQMTASLREKEQSLKRHAAELEERVQQRTQELAEQNLLLEEQWKQLQEIDEAKSRLFANLSHEFRTPLTLTIGPLEDVRSGLYGVQTEIVVQQLDIAIRNARRVLRLINQILDVAKIESSGLSVKLKPMDLGQFLNDLSDHYIPLAERKHIDFQVDAPSELVSINADPCQLEKVFSNLLSNAFKFTPDRGVIQLTMDAPERSSAREQWVIVRIRDNGCGIPEHQISHIFQRFYQAEQAHVQHFQAGTGIGLALAKELVELHHGRIEVKSELGFGSTFTVFLLPSPETDAAHISLLEKGDVELHSEFEQTQQLVSDWVAETNVSKRSGTAPPGDPSEDQTVILIVDDNPDICRYIRRHLTELYHVIEADNGASGLELARERLPDIVVSDLMMPDMDGLTLCQELKRDPELGYVPVILLTARAGESEKLDGLKVGADDYLSKPFNMSELKIRIANLIESRRRLKARYTRPIYLAPRQASVVSSDQRFLKRVQEAIEKQLGDPEFSVERLAQSVGQSRGNLHRRLRTILGLTPSDVIRDSRLQRGADLLQQQAGSISEIAYNVGFKGVAHFSTSFRNKYGVSPSTYRS